jgi:hypothetical protein
VMSEHGSLPKDIWNTVSNEYWKTCLLGRVVMKSSCQIWPQGYYSMYVSQIWPPVLNGL